MSTAKPSSKTSTRAETLEAAFAEVLAEPKQPEVIVRDWLGLLVASSGAKGGRLYRPNAAGDLKVAAAVGLASPDETTANEIVPHQDRLLQETFSSGRPRVVLGGREADNATDETNAPWAYAPLTVDEEVHGVIELVLTSDSSHEHQREAIQAAALAGSCFAEYERRRRDNEAKTRESLVDDVEQFTRSVHEKLDVRHTAYVIANNGRRLVGCNRLTVLLRRGGRYDVVAISGVDEVEARSQAAKLLGKLTKAATVTGESVHFKGRNEDLAPQVREALNRYLDEAHVREVSVVPLFPPASETKTEKQTFAARPQPLGAIVVEQIEDVLPRPGRVERAELVAQHGASALANALEYEAIPLLPFWKACRRVTRWFAPGTRAKTWGVIVAAAAAVSALCFIPADFALHARGTLQPAVRRHVFTPLDGTVKAIHVVHGQRVEAGQLLVELRNTDLDVSLADVTGRRTSTNEQLLATERTLHESESRITLKERHELAGRRSELKQRLAALDEQLTLLRHKREMLRITSPINGEITTWDVEQLLRNRPVRQGQVLIDVADSSSGWELELQVPEDGIDHLLSAQQVHGPGLAVHYRLAAEPRTDRLARLREVHYAAEIRGEEGNTVLAKATLAAEPASVLHPGAEATAKVYCGRRALGYVWLHDAVDFVRMKVWFRLY